MVWAAERNNKNKGFRKKQIMSLVYGHGRIPLKLQISYCCYLLWALNCWATQYYVVVPSYCLLTGVSLFPKLSSYWFLPFAYVFLGKYAYSFGEFYWCGGTLKGWWNDQRMWLYRRLTSYLFAFSYVLLKFIGFTNKTNFVITSKVSQQDASRRYHKELMEFGATSPPLMLNILSTLALLNLFSFLKGLKLLILDSNTNHLALQMILSALLILINLPLYQVLFLRKDNGRMPSSVTYQSTLLALLICALPNF